MSQFWKSIQTFSPDNLKNVFAEVFFYEKLKELNGEHDEWGGRKCNNCCIVISCEKKFAIIFRIGRNIS